jgi:ABC-2 type transport system permease protein
MLLKRQGISSHSLPPVIRIAKKELTLFFASPIAYLFLAAFVGVVFFVFFWAETFFSRNIADLRPMFQWMPLLLVFLSAALTMRMWSEERQAGILEYIQTRTVALWQFVLGKFLACLALLSLALALTVPLPIMVAYMGPVDWNLVVVGYTSTLFLGASYISMGLLVSARCKNQMISLIGASLLGGVFYIFGSNLLTDLMDSGTNLWLLRLGTASHYRDLIRGMLDVRDLYYYISLIAFFLILNAYFLEKERWSKQKNVKHKAWNFGVLLLMMNLLTAHFLLEQANIPRLDVTDTQRFSLSETTINYLKEIKEPMLIRGYISQENHPLLATIVPQLKDLLEEYRIASNGKIRIEWLDPLEDSQQEKLANQVYDIKPFSFNLQERHQSAIRSVYFHFLIEYGNAFQTLKYSDLIEANQKSRHGTEIHLRNPEFDFTSKIKKVVRSYHAGFNLYENFNEPVRLVTVFNPVETYNEKLQDFHQKVETYLQAQITESKGKLKRQSVVVGEGDATKNAQILKALAVQPVQGKDNQDALYFHIYLVDKDKVIQVPVQNLNMNRFLNDFKFSLKKLLPDMKKFVALITPEMDPNLKFENSGQQLIDGFLPEFKIFSYFMQQGYVVYPITKLAEQKIPSFVDTAVVAAPRYLSPEALFRLDQFLMRGGHVIVMTSPFYTQHFKTRDQHVLMPYESQVHDWLAHHGVNIEDSIVMDQRNKPAFMNIMRKQDGNHFINKERFQYPAFVNLTGDGFVDQSHMMNQNLQQATIPWASPIHIDEGKTKHLSVSTMFQSSENSWLVSIDDAMPKMKGNAMEPFNAAAVKQRYPLGVALEGQFHSYFNQDNIPSSIAQKNSESLQSYLKISGPSTKLFVLSSNAVVSDFVVKMITEGEKKNYFNSIQMVLSAVDWALADPLLLKIRGNNHLNRTLLTFDEATQKQIEYAIYGVAVFLLSLIALFVRLRHRQKKRNYYAILS